MGKRIKMFKLIIAGIEIHNCFELYRKAKSAGIEIWLEPQLNGGFEPQQITNGDELNSTLLNPTLKSWYVCTCKTPRKYRKVLKDRTLEPAKQKIVFRLLYENDFYKQRIYQGFSGDSH